MNKVSDWMIYSLLYENIIDEFISILILFLHKKRLQLVTQNFTLNKIIIFFNENLDLNYENIFTENYHTTIARVQYIERSHKKIRSE